MFEFVKFNELNDLVSVHLEIPALNHVMALQEAVKVIQREIIRREKQKPNNSTDFSPSGF